MKIKQFINEKPRLKKAIKIIGASVTIFFAAFGVLCSGLLIGSCANQKTKQVLATTPIKREFDYNGYNYILAYNDILNNEVIRNLKPLTPEFWYDPYENGQRHDIYLNIYEGNYAELGTSWTNVDWDTAVITGTTQKWGALHFYSTGWQDRGNDTYYYFLKMALFNTSTNTDIVTYSFTYMVNHGGLSGFIVDLWSQGSAPIYISRLDSPQLWDMLFGVSNLTYAQGYQVGYDTGRSQGISEGRQAGYEQGYRDGAQEVGLSNNPFQLIKNAFSSIANILNIQVLPNLPLGVLIFTPLIITIIIVVIKMIRG